MTRTDLHVDELASHAPAKTRSECHCLSAAWRKHHRLAVRMVLRTMMSGCRRLHIPGCHSPASGTPDRDNVFSIRASCRSPADGTYTVVAVRAEHVSSVRQRCVVALRASVLSVLRPVNRVDPLPDVDLAALVVLRHTAESPQCWPDCVRDGRKISGSIFRAR